MRGSVVRHTGRVTLLLLAVSVVVTCLAVWWLRPDSAAGWVGVVGGVLGPPVLWLAWASYRDDRAEADAALSLEEVADRLAVAVRGQWTAEAELQRLNNPHAIPVRWRPADPELVEDWPSLVRLATTDGAGWPPPSAAGTWAAGPGELAGGGNELADVLGRVPTGRLLVLGQPGAGKTVLLVRLMLDLLARRQPGGPVPVLAPLASWDPTAGQGFYGWLESRLVADHPGLANPAPGDSRVRRARALLDAGLVLPVLDGLDEIPDALRDRALAGINDALRPGPVVLSARTEPYRLTAARLAGAAVIELLPLDTTVIAGYLRMTAGGPVAARWDPVLATLTGSTPPPVARALATPLMTALARSVYNPRPGEHTGTLPNPAELLDPHRFPTRERVEQHLFDAYLPAAYRPHPDPARRCPWPAANAQRWLAFLAHHLQRPPTTPDIAWWQLPAALSPDRHWPYIFGLAGGLAAGLGFWLVLGLHSGLVAGLIAGWMVGMMAYLARNVQNPTQGPRRPHIFAAIAMFGWVIKILSNMFKGNVPLAVEAAAVVVFAVLRGFLPSTLIRADVRTAASPSTLLAKDRATFRSQVLAMVLVFGPGLGFLLGLMAVFTDGLAKGLTVGLTIGVLGFLVMGSFGAFFMASETAWVPFVLARCWLAIRRRLPWRLMAFLADAHEQRGVLRQAGGVYQFRHLKLQRRLAQRHERLP